MIRQLTPGERELFSSRSFIRHVEELRLESFAACKQLKSTLSPMDPLAAKLFKKFEDFLDCWGPEIEKVLILDDLIVNEEIPLWKE